MTNINSTASRSWFHYFNDLDACSALRYYDGIDGCDLETLQGRIQRIASRIDCVVDTEDPDPDTQALCSIMRVKSCPNFLKGIARAAKMGTQSSTKFLILSQ